LVKQTGCIRAGVSSLKISPEQISRLGQGMEDGYLASLHDHVRDYFPTVAAVMGDASMDPLVRDALTRARAHGFVGRASVRSYLDLMLLLGAAFDQDPALAFLRPCLNPDAERERLAAEAGENEPPEALEPDPIDMLEAAWEAAWAWLGEVAGDNYANLYKALMRLGGHVNSGADTPTDPKTLGHLCARVWPEKAERLGEAEVVAIAAAGLEKAAADGLATPEAQALMTLVAFVGGWGAHSDAAFAVDGVRAFAGVVDAPPMDQARVMRASVGVYCARMIDAARAEAARVA
jgi:hypothetical protein